MNKFLGTMVAGFLGAALLLGAAYATGVVGNSTTTKTVVKGEPASFTTTGLTPQQVYEQNVDRRRRDQVDVPRHHRHVGPVHR